MIQLDFWDYTGDVPVWRNRRALEQILGESFELAKQRRVPLLLETELGWPALAEEKGGLQWLSDVLDIAIEHDGHLSYGCYHWDDCGLYRGRSGLPGEDDANRELIDLFEAKREEASKANPDQ